jgi:chemotaxis protein methyltransferase CheR
LNLHDQASYPRAETGTSQCDVILCRNVLIYFDRASARGVIDRLTQALRPGGVFVLGPSEHSFERPDRLIRCQLKEGLVYRRVEEDAKASPKPPEFRPASGPTPRPAVIAKVIELPRPTGGELAREAWAQAERERFQEAIETAERALAHDPLDLSLHLLMGVVSDRLGNRLEAAGWFRKVLYLDPRHLLSRFYLANAYRGLGELADAEREFRTLLRYLQRRPVEESIEHDHRLTVGTLRQVCEKAIVRLNEPVMGDVA